MNYLKGLLNLHKFLEIIVFGKKPDKKSTILHNFYVQLETLVVRGWCILTIHNIMYTNAHTCYKIITLGLIH